MPSNKSPDKTYEVLIDTREKNPWDFPTNDFCKGFFFRKLDTGDYTLKGLEDKFVIEKKASTAEIAMNIFETRFEKELKRLDEFEHPYMIFEFDYNDIKLFPINSGLPKYLWHKLKMTSDIMEKTIARYQVQYRTKIIFAGKHGRDAATTLFKQILKYGNLNNEQ